MKVPKLLTYPLPSLHKKDFGEGAFIIGLDNSIYFKGRTFKDCLNSLPRKTKGYKIVVVQEFIL